MHLTNNINITFLFIECDEELLRDKIIKSLSKLWMKNATIIVF